MFSVSLLFATLAGWSIRVAGKGLRGGGVGERASLCAGKILREFEDRFPVGMLEGQKVGNRGKERRLRVCGRRNAALRGSGRKGYQETSRLSPVFNVVPRDCSFLPEDPKALVEQPFAHVFARYAQTRVWFRRGSFQPYSSRYPV